MGSVQKVSVPYFMRVISPTHLLHMSLFPNGIFFHQIFRVHAGAGFEGNFVAILALFDFVFFLNSEIWTRLEVL